MVATSDGDSPDDGRTRSDKRGQLNVPKGMLSAVMEDYIKTIYAIESDSDGRVSTSALADHLEVTAPTVSSMLKKLEERGLVDREEYKGVTRSRRRANSSLSRSSGTTVFSKRS